MLKTRHVIIALLLLLSSEAAVAQVSISINLSTYPKLVAVPGYPVYYAPRLATNYFFYDGMYWIYLDDNWYVSTWYNGPWDRVNPEVVPLFILRIPVRYYREPPAYFRGWRSDAPPHWGEHWGRGWEERRSGWDRWNRGAVPAPAPLPAYQRQYSGDRYPRQPEQQHELQQRNYRYQPSDPVVRKQYQERAAGQAPEQQGRPNIQDRAHPPQAAPEVRRHQAPQSEPEQRRQQAPQSQGREDRQQGNDAARPTKERQNRRQEQDQGHKRNE